jgi:hypothetical protein
MSSRCGWLTQVRGERASTWSPPPPPPPPLPLPLPPLLLLLLLLHA